VSIIWLPNILLLVIWRDFYLYPANMLKFKIIHICYVYLNKKMEELPAIQISDQ